MDSGTIKRKPPEGGLTVVEISEPFYCWQCPFYSAKMYCNITGKILGGIKGRDPVLPPENCFITNTDVIYIKHYGKQEQNMGNS